ncbi:MAG TPA: hypothetical protein VIV60_27260 [Polyangiaceae bacterium]
MPAVLAWLRAASSELERRRLYREHACASLFEFCVTRLGCSEDTAYKRVGAARLLQQFPVVFDFLANGRIHLTGLMLLKPYLTASNHQQWLLAASGKSKRQIEKPIATRCPQADVPSSRPRLNPMSEGRRGLFPSRVTPTAWYSRRAKHHIKAVDRLLGNRHLHREWPAVYNAIAQTLLVKVQRSVLTVDWSDFECGGSRKWAMIQASVPVGGRAVVIFARAFPFKRYNSPSAHREFLLGREGGLARRLQTDTHHRCRVSWTMVPCG